MTTLWLIPMSHHFIFELLSDVSSSLKALKKCPCINTRSRLLTDTIALCLLQNTKNHLAAAAAAAKSLQSCPTLCDPTDGSLSGSPVPGILQARTLEWFAIFLLHCIKVKVKSLSRVRLCATSWTAAHQAAPSIGFSRQEYWSGLPLPSPKEPP